MSALNGLNYRADEAIDQGIVATNDKIRTAETMAPLAKLEIKAPETTKKTLELHKEHVEDPLEDEEPIPSGGSRPLSSIHALPVELHLEIIQNLAHSTDPGLLDLREVSTYFRSIIELSDLFTWGTTLLQGREFKTADRLYAFLRVKDRLPCSLCQGLLPKERFHMQAKKGKKALGHKFGHTRFCIDCGIKHRKFGGANSVRVNNQSSFYRRVCSECFEFLDEPEGIPNCSVHY